jgi:hypothetical protein
MAFNHVRNVYVVFDHEKSFNYEKSGAKMAAIDAQ